MSRRADRIAASDAAGETVEIALLRSGSTEFETDIALHEGKSGAVAISERAVSLVLLKGDKPVRTVPLALEAGKTTVVH